MTATQDMQDRALPQANHDMPPLQTDTPEWRANHHAVLARYRELDPVHPVAITGAISGPQFVEWHVTRYDEAAAALKDRRLVKELQTVFGPDFTPAAAEKWPSLQESQANWMLLRDPPDHTRLRSLVSQAFTPRVVENLRPRIEHIARELAAALGEPGTVTDIIPGYAFALPVIVIAELLGVPPEDRGLFREWSYFIARSLDNSTEEELAAADRSIREIRSYLQDIAAWRKAAPQGDLISGLIAARDEGGRLTDQELIDTCILLLVAGHETTVNLIANGLLLLTQHPDQKELLLRRPELVTSAVEEVLRYEGSVQVTSRMAAEDIELGGRTICRGDWVTIWLAAANRDPAQFPDPNRFDVTRNPHRHLTFGGGVHFCLGAPLARLEGAIALGVFMAKFPGYEFAGEAPAWRPTVTFRTLAELPLHL